MSAGTPPPRSQRPGRHHHRWHHGAHPPRAHTLRRRLFLWFGAAIVLTVLVAVGVGSLSWRRGWRDQEDRIRDFVGDRYALVWDDPVARDELAHSMARHLGVAVELSDARGAPLGAHGPPCHGRPQRMPVERAGVRLGEVRLCWRPQRSGPWLWAGLFAGAVVVWALSGRVARRLGRPLEELARVARALGEGRLDARVTLHPNTHAEVVAVGQAVNEMAARIEAQLREQRELLAAVSHEIRTPLARLTVLTELLRDGGATPARLASVEAEVREIDALVGELLASARLDFSGAERRPLDLGEAARTALERAGLPADLLRVLAPAETPGAPAGVTLSADPTLVARALANLLRNAERHGGGPTALVVAAEPAAVTLTVEDDGPGFTPAALERAFEPFARGRAVAPAPGDSADGDAGRGGPEPDAPSLGLGLALVRRIAEAHGGVAFAHNRAPRGAAVGLRLPRSGAP